MSDLEQGDIVAARYRLLRPLGRGGAATTYEAEDQTLGGTVALKLLDSPELLRSFRSEFAHLAGLHHPHLLQVLDFGVHAGDLHYYTARYVRGVDLRTYAAGKTWTELVPTVVGLLEALDFLHGLALRHGDVKPGNVIVEDDGKPLLIDLGCARPFDARLYHVSGTPGYMAPELVRGEADRRADLFALGKTLEQITDAKSLPPSVRALIKRLKATDPRKRPEEVGHVLETLGAAPRTRAGGHAPQLLGRTPLLTRGGLLLEDASRGEGPRLIWLTASEGIGASRFLQELKWRAQLVTCAAPPHGPPHVVEARTASTRPISEMLSRAFDRDVDGLTAALDLALTRETVLLVDDAHTLEESELTLLLGVLRNVPPSAPLVAVVVARDAPPALDGHRVEQLTLPALERESVRAWFGEDVSEARLDDILRLTGGQPRALTFLADQLSAGDCALEDLQRLGALQPLSPSLRSRVEALGRAPRELLAELLVLGSLDADEVDVDAAHALEAAGLAHPEGATWRASAQWPQLRHALDKDLLTSRHAREAQRLEAQAQAERDPARAAMAWADCALHFVEAGELKSATRVLVTQRAAFPLAATRFLRAADALLTRTPDDLAARLAVAHAAAAAGRAERALATVEGIDGDAPDVALLRASCLFRLGRAAEVVDLLEPIAALVRDPSQRGEVADLLARAQFKRARYKSAVRVVQDTRRAIKGRISPALEGRLQGVMGLCLSYLGKQADAREALAQAERLTTDADPRTRVRVLGYSGIDEYRRGEYANAVEAYARALEIAEREGLSDLVASGALNLGSAQHLLGDWGAALQSYERGRRVAYALGQRTTVVTLDFDLAKLYADVGSVERACTLAQRALEGAEGAEMGLMAAAAHSVIGEALILAENPRALEQLAIAKERFQKQGAQREVLEVTLAEVEAHLVLGDPQHAGALLDRSRDAVAADESPDLMARAELLLGRLNARDPRRAERCFREALELASDANLRMLEAEACARLTAMLFALGERESGRTYEERALRRWESVSADLPEPLREAFWAHPLRSGLRRPRQRPDAMDLPTVERPAFRDERLRRLLQINAQLNASRDVDRVLNLAVDAGIELSGAERGFLLVCDGSGEDADASAMRVAVARNLDRARIGQAHVKWSRSIAERVVQSLEPVVTLDAATDERFVDEASIHALRLKSVACVPVRSPEGVLGALYVDNRFAARSFDDADVEVLLALADQVAIALWNAKLVTQLQQEKERVTELLRARERDVLQLSRRVKDQKVEPTFRYDYAGLAGRGDAMRQMLALLDRVTDSDVPLLLEGESGVGKERVARTVHGNGPLRSGPFLTLRCSGARDSFLETELLGRAGDALAAVPEARDGLLRAASGGTLFLDEVEALPDATQAILVRVLRERRITPVGGSASIPLETRIICATTRRLSTLVGEGRFRSDLYFELSVVEVKVPPLRDRKEDLPALLEQLSAANGGAPLQVTEEALSQLTRHSWPGNVRELGTLVQRVALLTGGVLDAQVVGEFLSRATPVAPRLESGDRAKLEAALEVHAWNVSEVCRALAIPRATFYRNLKRYGLERPRRH